MPSEHAKLSASGAYRWINCPGSIRLSEQCPPETPSPYAEEGTVAHTMAELKLTLAYMSSGDVYSPEDLKEIREDLEKARSLGSCTAEMEEATDRYVEAIGELLSEAGDDAELMAEQRFKLTDWIPGGFGTSDAVIVSEDRIQVIDLKYGKGVRVDAVGNPQLRLYGLGAASLFSGVYDFETVCMTIIQPRLDHISTEEVPLKELQRWGANVVAPRAKEALGKDAEVKAGVWCRWCPAKALCRVRAEENLALQKLDYAPPDLLDPEELGDILQRGKALESWVKDVEDYCFHQALAGEKIDGWKIVEGRSVRKYKDELAVAEKLREAGYDDAMLYERKLLGLTAMEKLVGKKKLTETLGDLIVKPAGKPVLVPESDKRPEMNTADDFKEGI